MPFVKHTGSMNLLNIMWIHVLSSMGSNTLEKLKRIKTELTNKSSKKDDLSRNTPITLINSF
jgi:hypothetical protein